MNSDWKNMWDERFGQDEYAYGTLPNRYLEEQLPKLAKGSILFGAEGEGRNAVYAAEKGWSVSAFDISKSGMDKCQRLAAERGVDIDYRLGNLPDLKFEEESYDVVALIYAHFPPEIRSEYHRILQSLLKPGGTVIFEGFGKNHLEWRAKNPSIGGPGVQELLFTEEEIIRDFDECEPIELQEQVMKLKQGRYHDGTGSVLRFLGRKEKA